VGLGQPALEAVGVDPAFWDGRAVLVTGHSGFKGGWLTLWLESMGARMTGYSLPERDVRDAASLHEAFGAARPEVVLHLAAQPLVRRSYRDPAETYATNVTGTLNVLEAARACDSVRAVVNVTTDKVYENTGRVTGYSEDDPLGGADPYSSSKACSEIVSAAYRRSFGLNVATARAGNVIGGGDWAEDRLVPDTIRAALAGGTVTVRNPASVRPWQHVLEPLSGYLMLAERLHGSPDHATGWNFGPADADSRPAGEVVERLAALWPGGIPVTAGSDPHAPHEAELLKLDSARARERLGWAPAWGLDEALRAVVEWHVADRYRADTRALALEQIRAHQAAQCAP
jgi:CDP-glucose 4,6-dehydratase